MVAKQKSQLMREIRQKRRDAGLVEFRKWVNLDQKDELQKLFDSFSDK